VALPRLLTYEEVAEYFGVSVRTVYNWVRVGKLPQPINRRWSEAVIWGYVNR